MRKQALEGLKVVEFGGYAAGPVVGKHLADHGAEVIRIESRTRLDGFRTHYPPFKDNLPGIERAGLFALCNNNKSSVTQNLKRSEGVALAKRLAARADIVIENFTPGTMARLGLDYPTLALLNPGLVMLSTCNQGQTGRRANHPGFGSHLSSMGGFTHLTGFPEGSPQLLYGPYIDYIAVGFGVVAVLAALEHRRRTGRGQYIDLAQYEAGLQFMAVALLEEACNGRVMERMGNRSPYAAPHGVYPCRGEDRWLALSIWDDAEWARLAALIGPDGWAADPTWASFAGRTARGDELDRRLAEWTLGWEAEPLAERLQSVGIRAVPLASVADLFTDPQLKFLGIWQPLLHPDIGEYHGEGPPYHLSATPAVLARPAPRLGEHTRTVCCGILGMSDDEFARLEAAGTFE